jgi:hypothetical protein
MSRLDSGAAPAREALELLARTVGLASHHDDLKALRTFPTQRAERPMDKISGSREGEKSDRICGDFFPTYALSATGRSYSNLAGLNKVVLELGAKRLCR